MSSHLDVLGRSLPLVTNHLPLRHKVSVSTDDRSDGIRRDIEVVESRRTLCNVRVSVESFLVGLHTITYFLLFRISVYQVSN